MGVQKMPSTGKMLVLHEVWRERKQYVQPVAQSIILSLSVQTEFKLIQCHFLSLLILLYIKICVDQVQSLKSLKVSKDLVSQSL